MTMTTLTRARLATGLVAAVALASIAGCGGSPTILPTNDFNRPTDLAFMCFGAFDDNGDLRVSGRPMRSCHPPGQDPEPSVTARTFAFLPNSASGDLSMIDADNWHIIDIGTANAGYGRLPLGEIAEQISVSQDGCRLVSANRGSCNLTMIDPSIFVQPVLQAKSDVPINPPDVPVAAPETPVDGNGAPLQVAPYEVAFLPQDTSELDGGALLCGKDAAQTSTPWRVLVTYPSCDLVALIDLPSFRIVDSVKVGLDADNKVVLTPQGTTPVCPISDCGPDQKTPVAVPPQTRPSSIAIVPMGDRAYVGLSSAPFILSLPIDAAAGTIGAATGTAIALHDGAVGSNRIRLAVDPYHYKTPDDERYAGIFVGDDRGRRFLYAIARDGTLAAIDVFLPGAEKECETNIDPLNLPAGMTREQAANERCLAPDPAHRRPNADGPALRFPTAPVDVMAADIPFDDDTDTREESVGGAYAWVLTANGYTYLVNIDPVLRQFSAVLQQGDVFVANATETEQTPFVNSFRDRNELSYSLSLDPSSGPPRVDVPPLLPLSGPYIEPLWTKGTLDDATALDVSARQTSIFFRDRTAVTPQTWGVTWQGSIIGPRYAGRLLVRDNNMVLQDDGVDYCYAGPGVISGDIVTINGCKEDTECGAGLACLRDKTADVAAGGLSVSGLCVNKDDKDRLQKSGICAPFTRTVRRYEVATAHGQTLELIPHLDEVVRSTLTQCRLPPDPQTPPAEAPPNDCADPSDPSTATYFTCQVDPFGGPENRCLRRCEMDGDCRQGRICQAIYDPKDTRPYPPPDVSQSEKPNYKQSKGTYCVDAPPFEGADQTACFYQLLNYDVRVGRGFLVSGNVVGIPGSGTKLPIVGDPNAPAVCAPAPRDDATSRSYRQVSRIAIDGPGANVCNPSKDNELDSRSRPPESATSAAFPSDSDAAKLLELVKSNPLPNPCLFMGGPVLSDPAAGSTQPAAAPPRHVRALFMNTEITFILANLDRAPSSTLDLRFDVRGGFRPQIVVPQSTIEISMPTRILLGPMTAAEQNDVATGEIPYVFVVDQRRLGLGLGGGPTRGQLLRIDPRGYSATLTTAGGNQPIYDDFTRSGGLFPVQ
jgi:hypothetical protein